MKALQFLIDAVAGVPIWPSIIPDASPSSSSPPDFNTILFKLYDDIQITTDSQGNITDIIPINPVTSGASGTITVQARPSSDSPWLNLEDGTLDVSMNEIMAQPQGLITGIKATPASASGFNYILCELYRGS